MNRTAPVIAGLVIAALGALALTRGMMRPIRTLSDAEAAALRPYRLRVVPAAGTSPAQLAARLPYRDLRMERLLVLNGVDLQSELARLSEIKTVEP